MWNFNAPRLPTRSCLPDPKGRSRRPFAPTRTWWSPAAANEPLSLSEPPARPPAADSDDCRRAAGQGKCESTGESGARRRGLLTRVWRAITERRTKKEKRIVIRVSNQRPADSVCRPLTLFVFQFFAFTLLQSGQPGFASPKLSSLIPIRSMMPRYRLHILRFSSPAFR